MSAEPERSAWVGSLRLHEFVPAVQYIQANRARYRLMEAYHELFKDMDVLIGSALGPTNLTGHPEIAFAHAFQRRTDFHLKRPKL